MTQKNKKFWTFKDKGNKTGELTLYGEISSSTWFGDEVTPKQFKEDLEALGDIDTLNIYINSPGGDIFAGQAILSMLKRHSARKIVHIDGLAASAASVVAMAGDVIRMPRNAMMMIHNPWTVAAGNASELRAVADALDRTTDAMIAAYQEKAGLDQDEIRALMANETWMTADEAVERGFADEIEEVKQVAACVEEKYYAVYRNIPEKLKKPPGEEVKNSDTDIKKRKLLLELEL